MKKPIALHLILIALLIPACSSMAGPPPIPVPTVTSTSTPLPTATNTETSAPTNPAIPPTENSDVLSALLPDGQPDTEWNGIPVMPGAILGDGDIDAYRFTIKATRDEIQSYYERELANLGWEPMASGEGNAGVFLMFFTDPQDATLTVTIVPNGDEFLVMLVK